MGRFIFYNYEYISCYFKTDPDPKGGPDVSCINDHEVVTDIKQECHGKVRYSIGT